ncbi:MAG: DUF262 domain-containing protein [Ferruginibacter sp.]|nr:DUF262 domain-containing protein [Ferruginibacter sp.]
MEQTKALIDLFGKEFIIPHYQRGYRWEPQEVEELLNDLWDFEKSSNKGEFYCLQPIVLQNKGQGKYHVLDGQQRLTTLYLIITFLEEIRNDSGYSQSLFSLDYETRDNCREYLESKRFTGALDESNIDYYHITKAYQAIKAWFADIKHAGAKMKLVPVLMDKNDKGNRNVRFIWYEVEKDINPIDIFIRLNVGKIPLTDAELTKALLLQADKYTADELKFYKMRLFEIANEWDNIEYTLQNDEFWYFISNHSNTRPTHIEYIFDLIAKKILAEKKYFEKPPIKHATFLILSAYLDEQIDNGKPRIKAVEDIWHQVTEYFEYFRDWFQNRILYHYIGFLIVELGNQVVDTLIRKSKELTKTGFINYLESEIGKRILINKRRKDSDGEEYQVKIENLNYINEDQRSNDQPEIKRILLLHNVFASLKSDKEQARFPFNLYKETKRNEKWSLEHIHAQNSEHIVKKENQKAWLSDHIQSLTSQNKAEFSGLLGRMKLLLEADEIEKEEFELIVDNVYTALNEFSDADDHHVHSISNLCLVDSHTNSQLNNSVFDVKREIIKNREFKGHYIPVCTRNIFMKGYTVYPVNNAYWTAEDRKGYLGNLKIMYDQFVNAIIKN